MKGYFKSSIDINDFNKALVEIVKRNTYSKKDLDEIDKKTDFLYNFILLKRNMENVGVKMNSVPDLEKNQQYGSNDIMKYNRIVNNCLKDEETNRKVSFFLV